MFSAYCEGHGSLVLLFTENIEALINHAWGIEVKWRCHCGATGVTEHRTSGDCKETAA